MSNVYYMKYMYYKESLKYTPGIYPTDTLQDFATLIVILMDILVTSVFASFFTHDARLASLVLRCVLSMVRVLYWDYFKVMKLNL